MILDLRISNSILFAAIKLWLSVLFSNFSLGFVFSLNHEKVIESDGGKGPNGKEQKERGRIAI